MTAIYILQTVRPLASLPLQPGDLVFGDFTPLQRAHIAAAHARAYPTLFVDGTVCVERLVPRTQYSVFATEELFTQWLQAKYNPRFILWAKRKKKQWILPEIV